MPIVPDLILLLFQKLLKNRGKLLIYTAQEVQNFNIWVFGPEIVSLQSLL